MTVTIEEAKDRLEELTALASGGEEVILVQKDSRRVALQPLETEDIPRERVFGLWAGKMNVGDEIFDPMPDDWLDAFYSGPVFPDESDVPTPLPEAGDR